MYDKTFAERFAWLRKHVRKLNGDRYSIDDIATESGISRSYLYELVRGEKDNPSMETLEALAAVFRVNPLFFSRDPRNYLPPVPSEQLQMALRSVGQLTDGDKRTLDDLLAQARQLVEESKQKADS